MNAIPLRTVRWQCPHCRRTRAKRAATEAHIGRCWLNPEVRTCRTCTWYEPAHDACGCEPGCNWGSSDGAVPPDCGADCEVPADGTPVTHCPKWEPPEDEKPR